MNRRLHHAWIGRFLSRLDRLSYQSFFLLWILNIVCFALIYLILSYSPGNGPTSLGESVSARFWNALYYSTITSTNTGYGDILPHGLSRFFAALETVTGLFLFAVFVAKLMSERQDIALKDVHRIAFENTFHNIREDLHVVRGDFDRIMREGTGKRGLSEEHWEELAVAYKQIANLVSEIPHLYSATNRLYTIDDRREELLLEAVHRTLARINTLLETLSARKIDWVSDRASAPELREFLKAIENLVPAWRTHSPYRRTTQFEEITHLAESVKAQLQRALPV